MVQNVLIGIGAGAACALLSVAGAYGPPSAIVLIIFASLPILIAAIGWSHRAALVGIVAAGLGLAAVFNFTAALVIILTVGVPAWWLGYLALLARTDDTTGRIRRHRGSPPSWGAITKAAVMIASAG